MIYTSEEIKIKLGYSVKTAITDVHFKNQHKIKKLGVNAWRILNPAHNSSGEAIIKYSGPFDKRVAGGRILAFTKTLLSSGCSFKIEYTNDKARISWG